MNLGTLTTEGSLALERLDATLIGTDAYLGVAYFWAYAYRYPMRDLSPSARRRIHTLMLERILQPDGESDLHAQAIEDGLTWADKRHLIRVYGQVWA